MSDKPTADFDPRLLDLHLGHLSRPEQETLRARIAADPALAAQERALAGVFAALHRLAALEAPPGLAARVVARARAAGRAPRRIRPRDAVTAALERDAARLVRLGSLRDIVAVAALLVLAVGVGVPGLLHMRERSQRVGCSWNLAQLGRGVQQYASVFGSSLPFAGWSGGHSSWQPTGEPGVVMVPNRQHIYPLLRLAYVSEPRLFICPGLSGVPMPPQEIQRRDDFLEARNVSYAYQNMAGVRPCANDHPELPILADDNPLFDEGRPLFDSRRFRWGDRAAENSHAHGGAGQNILTLTGSVKWATTPRVGVGGDNIWILRGITRYTGREGPLAATDSHLLK